MREELKRLTTKEPGGKVEGRLDHAVLALCAKDGSLSFFQQPAILCPERGAEVEELLSPKGRQDLETERVLPAVQEGEVSRAVNGNKQERSESEICASIATYEAAAELTL